MIVFDVDIACVIVVFGNFDDYSIVWEEVGNGGSPFDDDEIIWVANGFFEVFEHDTGVLQAVEIVVDEALVMGKSIGFGDGKTGAGDGMFHT